MAGRLERLREGLGGGWEGEGCPRARPRGHSGGSAQPWESAEVLVRAWRGGSWGGIWKVAAPRKVAGDFWLCKPVPSSTRVWVPAPLRLPFCPFSMLSHPAVRTSGAGRKESRSPTPLAGANRIGGDSRNVASYANKVFRGENCRGEGEEGREPLSSPIAFPQHRAKVFSS